MKSMTVLILATGLAFNAGADNADEGEAFKALLEKVNARLIGAVLNNVAFDVSLHRYYAEQE